MKRNIFEEPICGDILTDRLVPPEMELDETKMTEDEIRVWKFLQERVST